MAEMFMDKDRREIHRKLRILRHAEETRQTNGLFLPRQV
jgi:hypothetical protein